MGIGLILVWLLVLVAVIGVIWAVAVGLARQGHSLDEPPKSEVTDAPLDPAHQQQLRGIDQQ